VAFTELASVRPQAYDIADGRTVTRCAAPVDRWHSRWDDPPRWRRAQALSPDSGSAPRNHRRRRGLRPISDFTEAPD